MEDVTYSRYFPFRDYYEKVVIPINPKRFKFDSKHDFMVCPLHNDHDPSLGIIDTKTKGEIFHCFGCNSHGNVVEFHIRISRQYLNKVLSFEEAVAELCSLFGVDKNKIDIAAGDYSSQDRYIRRQIAMNNALDSFDLSDYKMEFIRGKMEKKSMVYFNSLLIRAISYVKEFDEDEEEVD